MAKVKLEFILLGVLLQRPQTGYELQQFMKTTGRFMRSNTSMTQVYRSLRAMDDDGWLDHVVEPRVGAQDAKRYSVTDSGKAAFFDWLGQPHKPGPAPGGQAFGARLRFRSMFLGRNSVIELLDVEIDFWEQHRARYRHRDRSELYTADAPLDAELAGAIFYWEHLYGATGVDTHLAAVTELRDTPVAGDLPALDLANPLLPASPEDGTDQSSEGAA